MIVRMVQLSVILRERNICENYEKSKEGSIVVDRVETSHTLQMSRSSHGRGGHIQQEQTTVPEIDFSEVLQSTAHRRKRVQLVSSKSPQVQYTDDRMQKRYSGALRNELADSSVRTTDSVLWEYMCKVGKTPPEKALLKIISDYDHRDRTQELEKSINHLEELINGGNDRPMILELWKKTLKGKKNQLVDHQEVVPGTPESSDDEDEEDDEHDSTFCAVESQKNSPMVPPNQRTNHKGNYTYLQQQHIIPQKLIASVKPHTKSRNSNGWSVSIQQEQLNIDAHVFNVGIDTSRKGLEINQSYMENEAFLTMFSYGGGKRKKNDSDADFDPLDAKKRKKRKRIMKKNRKRKKGPERSSEQKDRVQVVNDNRPKGDNRSSKQKARVKVANAKTNADRAQGDNRSSD